MPTPFSVYTGTNYASLTDALLAQNSGVSIVSDSIELVLSGPSAVNYYDGSLISLGIGPGLLLTSGTTPGTSNTLGWFGTDNSGSSGFNNGDADINAVVNSVFQTQSYDATTFSFDFTVSDPTASSVTFDLVFGSDEFPEWVDQFVDAAVVMVNGVNYALFNHDPLHPLSVISSNLAAGYFIDNANNALPIEYDGVSHLLKIVAPIHAGTNSIKIGIADTGDHIYDSGVFLANFSASDIPGSGVVVTPPGSGTDNSDTVTGSSKDEYFDLKDGDDTVYAGGGDDIVVAGGGDDDVFCGSGDDEAKGDGGNDDIDGGDGIDTAVFSGASSEYSAVYDSLAGKYLITDSKTGVDSEGIDTLTNTEYVKFSDGYFKLDPSGLIAAPAPGGGTTGNNPGTVLIAGIGSVGSELTAIVNDLDGLPELIDYQWQLSDGNGWIAVGTNSDVYTVAANDAGLQIRVIASYLDNAATSENPISAEKTILDANSGDLIVTLIQLTAPIGSSTMNPLTTLVQDAIDLGVSPNLANVYVKQVFGIDPAIDLQHYDAWSILQANPNDAVALSFEMVAVQVAILTSLSDDDTGVSLTLAVLNAAENGQQLDLADANDLASILGVDISGISDKNLYPQPLREIFDRNSSMSDAIADGGNVSDIEQEWLDLLSINDGINSTSIADLSVHLNQAPIGFATATMQDGAFATPYLLTMADLLTGFSDPDGDALTVEGLAANSGGMLQDNGDGTWTFTPDTAFSGPVELSYLVSDGLGASAAASQMFVISMPPPNHAPTLANLLPDQYAAFNAQFNFVIPPETFNDADVGDTLGYSATLADGSALPTWLGFEATSGTFSGMPGKNHVGALDIQVTATDSAGESVSDTFSLKVISLIEGGIGDDMLSGTAVDDLIYGYEGNDSLVGKDGTDRLEGGEGNDWLNGGAGTDTLLGGAGNDTYLVDEAGDVVIEADGEGTDAVRASVSYGLSANVEKLALIGGDNIDGTGNDLNNTLTGNSGNNLLQGGEGNDRLNGDQGADTLIGGQGIDYLIGGTDSDQFVFNALLGSGVDKIADFEHGIDQIVLDGAVFSGFGLSGMPDSGMLATGVGMTKAADADDHLIYNTSNGSLYYDADGAGGAASMRIAILLGTPSITYDDFFIA